MSAVDEYNELIDRCQWTCAADIITSADFAVHELEADVAGLLSNTHKAEAELAALKAENERLLDDAAEFLSLLCPEGRPARGWQPSDGVIIPNVEAKKMWRDHLKKRAERET